MQGERQRIALVTGASSGIGEALCRLLVKEGYRCIAVARSQAKLARLQEELGGADTLLALPCDVTALEQVQAVVAQLHSRRLLPSLFFLNAGMAGLPALDPAGAGLLQHHRDLFAVNYFGALNWVEAWRSLGLAKDQKATFLATSSINATFAPPRGSAYAASKAALAKAFEALDLQYSAEGLRFLVSFPGPVATAGLVGKLPFTWPAEKMAAALLHQALRGKARHSPALFYALLARWLRHLPYAVTRTLLNQA